MVGSMVGGREIPEPLLLLASMTPDPLLASMVTPLASGLQPQVCRVASARAAHPVCSAVVLVLMSNSSYIFRPTACGTSSHPL